MNAPCPPQFEAFDPRILRRALGNFATGVTIVTAHDGVGQVGVTANSFSSVSLDPPLILWSIDKRSSSYAVFERSEHFAVNVLAVDQIALSNQFAGPHKDRFSSVPVRSGAGGCALLEGTSANFQCQKYQTLDGGDHWVLIGRVVAFEDNGRSPLLYHQGSYSMALPHRERQRLPERSAGGSRERLADHTYYLMTQAVRSYQQSYQPEQIRTGWRPGEARVLMILDAGRPLDVSSLVQETDMPLREIEQTLEMLRGREFVQSDGGYYQLTAAGAEQARKVWTLAQHFEDKVFSRFEPAQVRAFKDILKGVIAATTAPID
ncbi:flavin reductase family protein [Alcaligenaceae bacterium CGII-47]|nr:flavin reductase family protein [Alcaligenaceae bacterium CGII-47]